jgi:predicted aconitase with swiveling domain
MIVEDPDTTLVAGAVIWRIPLVDRVEKGFYKQVKNGSEVQVDADRGRITLTIEGAYASAKAKSALNEPRRPAC